MKCFVKKSRLMLSRFVTSVIFTNYNAHLYKKKLNQFLSAIFPKPRLQSKIKLINLFPLAHRSIKKGTQSFCSNSIVLIISDIFIFRISLSILSCLPIKFCSMLIHYKEITYICAEFKKGWIRFFIQMRKLFLILKLRMWMKGV